MLEILGVVALALVLYGLGFAVGRYRQTEETRRLCEKFDQEVAKVKTAKRIGEMLARRPTSRCDACGEEAQGVRFGNHQLRREGKRLVKCSGTWTLVPLTDDDVTVEGQKP